MHSPPAICEKRGPPAPRRGGPPPIRRCAPPPPGPGHVEGQVQDQKRASLLTPAYKRKGSRAMASLAHHANPIPKRQNFLLEWSFPTTVPTPSCPIPRANRAVESRPVYGAWAPRLRAYPTRRAPDPILDVSSVRVPSSRKAHRIRSTVISGAKKEPTWGNAPSAPPGRYEILP